MTVSGQPIAVEGYLARFGDNLVSVTYGGVTDAAAASPIAAKLLQQAADKAKDVL
jgi:hypothetical protein